MATAAKLERRILKEKSQYCSYDEENWVCKYVSCSID